MHQLICFFFLMFLTISSTNFDSIWENKFSDFVYLCLDCITNYLKIGITAIIAFIKKKMIIIILKDNLVRISLFLSKCSNSDDGDNDNSTFVVDCD